MWEYLKSNAGNPLWGVGYENFWLGARLEQAWEQFGGAQILQAHNGYLEVYLNLGYIGVALIVCNMLSGLLKVGKCLYVDFPTGILRLSFIVVVLVYNYTEATFSGINNLWLVFLLGAIDPPFRRIK